MRRILIAEKPSRGYGMPWKGDTPCFNFKAPNEHFRADETENIGFGAEIETLVIGCDLPDYRFISKMVNLRQLYIYSGKNISDMAFIESLIYLRQLFIDESHITSLEPLASLIAEKSRLYNEDPDNIENMIKYAFEAVCICSDRLDCDPDDFKDDDVLYTRDFVINKKSVTDPLRPHYPR